MEAALGIGASWIWIGLGLLLIALPVVPACNASLSLAGWVVFGALAFFPALLPTLLLILGIAELREAKKSDGYWRHFIWCCICTLSYWIVVLYLGAWKCFVIPAPMTLNGWTFLWIAATFGGWFIVIAIVSLIVKVPFGLTGSEQETQGSQK
ncbi:MAG: hypothetical protein EBZ48_09155 [Proteobacteria bacterium]|nr:hypothetical protein [Pseudomonadota bacterium]